MTQAVLWLAILCGVAGALTGNRTAWALLVSVGLCLLLQWQRVQFDPALWLLIDFAVIAWILTRALTCLRWNIFALFLALPHGDKLVLCLFAPAWLAYFLPPEPRYFMGLSAVAAQLFLTFPLAAAWGRIRRINAHFDPWDHFNLRARHGT